MKKKVDDILILNRIKNGDESAFKFLFETYFSSLCRFACLYVKEHKIAEEIALDVFTLIWENRDSIEIRVTFKAYLFQATKNRAYNYLRDNERYFVVSDFSILEKFEEDYTFESQELMGLIEEAISSLPLNNRLVFTKSRVENLSNKEIAEQMQVSVKTVEAHITKALKHIRTYLGESYSYFF